MVFAVGSAAIAAAAGPDGDAGTALPPGGPWEQPAPQVPGVPPQWLDFQIDWKDTAAATLEANSPERLLEKLKSNPALAAQAEQIAPLRTVRVNEAVVKRWGDDRETSRQCCRRIAEAYRRVEYWPGVLWYGWRLVVLAAEDKALRGEGYQTMTAARWDRFAEQPAMSQWAPIFPRAIADLLASGRWGHRQVWWPIYRGLQVYKLRSRYFYETVCDFHRAIDTSGASQAAMDDTTAILVETLGQPAIAARFFARAGNPRALSLAPESDANVGDWLALSRLRQQWKDIMHNVRLRKSDAVTSGRIGAVLGQADDNALLVPIDEGDRYEPLRAVLLRDIEAMAPEVRDALREAQDRATAWVAQPSQTGGDADETLRLLRQYPYSLRVQRRAADAAEAALRQGHWLWADRTFLDIQRFTTDPTLRREAALGRAMALAMSGADPATVQAATALLGDDAEVPWRGQTVRAGQIKTLLASAAVAAPVRPARIGQVRRVALPEAWYWRRTPAPVLAAEPQARGAWPVSTVQTVGADLIVAADNGGIAAFPAGASAAAWSQIVAAPVVPVVGPVPNRSQQGQVPWWMTMPTRPVAVSDAPGSEGFICRLWPQAAGGRSIPAIAGFATASGRLLWTTGGRGEWADLQPCSEPAMVEGRAYLLCTETAGGMLRLVCLSAADGRLLWNRSLGLPGGQGPLCGVTIHDGSIYATTQTGFVAKCDGRDGLIEWIGTYRSWTWREDGVDGYHCRLPPMLHTRQGGPPLIVGDAVVMAPRDHGGAVAFDRNSGKRLWETLFVAADQIVGAAGRAVVLKGGHWIGAIDTGTGRQLWRKSFDEETGDNAVLVGPEACVLVAGKLHRFSAASGEPTAEAAALDGAGDGARGGVQRVLLADGSIVEFAEALPAAAAAARRAGGPPSLGLEEIWTLPRSAPRVWFDGGDSAEGFCVTTEDRVLRVTRSGGYRVLWEQVPPVRPCKVQATKTRIVVAEGRALACLEPASGALRWSTRVPLRVEQFGGSEQLVYVAHPWTDCYLAAIDAATGKLLWHRAFENSRSGFGEPGAFVRWLDTGAAASIEVTRQTNRERLLVEARSGQHGPPAGGDFPGGWWLWRDARDGSDAYIGQDRRVHVPTNGWQSDRAAGWERKVDQWDPHRDAEAVDVFTHGPRIGVRLNGTLWAYDPATKVEVEYAVPAQHAGPTQARTVLAFRDVGETTVVVSSVPARPETLGVPTDPQGQPPPVRVRHVRVDVFERGTGKWIEGDRIDGLAADATQTLQAWFWDKDLLVTDARGVHIFRMSR